MSSSTNTTLFSKLSRAVPGVVSYELARSMTPSRWAMFLLMVSGIMLWLIYGILIGDLPLIVANAVTLVLAASILIAKIRFR